MALSLGIVMVFRQRLGERGERFLQDVVGLQRREVPSQVVPAHRRIAGDELRPPRMTHVTADLPKQGR